MTRTPLVASLALALATATALIPSGAGGQVAAPQAAPEEFMTGAEPIAEGDYAALPKLEKFRAFLPKQVDLTAKFPQPGHQGLQPNCVAWATTYAARSFLYAQDTGQQPSGPEQQMSPAYVYNRLRPAGSMCNKAIRIVDALNFLQREGTVTLADFPDDIMRCPIPAPESLKGKAGAYRLAGWRAVARERKQPGDRATVVVDDIKGALYRGEPVVFAMPVMGDFKALRGDTVYQRSEPATTNLHAMTVIGYDEARQAFRIINSWGAGWGDRGYAWIDYATFKLLVTEAYSLQDDPARQASKPPAAASDPRGRLDALLARLPCGVGRVEQTGRTLTVTGFGGDAAALAELKVAALAASPKVDWRMAHHPWPQCEAELTLTPALAAGTVALTVQTADGRPRKGDPVALRAGEFFGISADVPASRPYLSLVYLQADGSAVVLFQGPAQPAAAGRHSVTIGLSGDVAERFRVTEPFGNEMVLALASTGPLFGTELADHATEREFLTLLRARLAGAAPGDIEAAVVRLRTRP